MGKVGRTLLILGDECDVCSDAFLEKQRPWTVCNKHFRMAKLFLQKRGYSVAEIDVDE